MPRSHRCARLHPKTSLARLTLPVSVLLLPWFSACEYRAKWQVCCNKNRKRHSRNGPYNWRGCNSLIHTTLSNLSGLRLLLRRNGETRRRRPEAWRKHALRRQLRLPPRGHVDVDIYRDGIKRWPYRRAKNDWYMVGRSLFLHLHNCSA